MILAFNWIIGGTDGHAKNVSLLHGPGNYTRLAPAYDLASWLRYERDPRSRKVKLAMKIGGTCRLNEIDAGRWEKWAVEADLEPGWTAACVLTVADRIAEASAGIAVEAATDGEAEFLGNLRQLLARRARECAASFR